MGIGHISVNGSGMPTKILTKSAWYSLRKSKYLLRQLFFFHKTENPDTASNFHYSADYESITR